VYTRCTSILVYSISIESERHIARSYSNPEFRVFLSFLHTPTDLPFRLLRSPLKISLISRFASVSGRPLISCALAIRCLRLISFALPRLLLVIYSDPKNRIATSTSWRLALIWMIPLRTLIIIGSHHCAEFVSTTPTVFFSLHVGLAVLVTPTVLGPDISISPRRFPKIHIFLNCSCVDLTLLLLPRGTDRTWCSLPLVGNFSCCSLS
jgi:hypothetical protein